MVDETISLFGIKRRFLRSTQLERDWHDPLALQDYVVTDYINENLNQIAAGLRPASGLRAWRITGDYGSGKSSFGLLLARLLYTGLDELPESFDVFVNNYSSFNAFKEPAGLFPILVTGLREPLALSITKGLLNAFSNHEGIIPVGLLEEWKAAIKDKNIVDDQVTNWLKVVHKHLIKSGLARGTFLLLDEAGKFLEFAARHPDQQDIYLLQTLAEFAARSGANPFYITLLLHQGVSAYAEALPAVYQKEWEKIAGRFEELLWHQPAEQVTQLISHAISINIDAIDYSRRVQAKEAMQKCLKLHWYGAATSESLLLTIADTLYPLHPTVIPPLIRFFTLYGQNERSLFAFLLGYEPFGLQDFVERTGGKQFYCISNLYNYVCSFLGSRVHANDVKSKWRAIETIVDRYNAGRDQYSDLVKTIGLLNILNADELIPSVELLQLSLPEDINVNAKLTDLQANHHIYYRGRAGGFSLWPYTSVNLQASYENASKVIGGAQNISSDIKNELEDQPIVARRHYIATGNLRYFEVKYCEATALQKVAEESFDADGRIIIPLCETAKERQAAIEAAQNFNKLNILIAVPMPLEGLAPYVIDLKRWEWVERHTTGLEYDSFAKEEISRQLERATNKLQSQIQKTVGIIATSEFGGAEWYWKGERKDCPEIRDIMNLLTEVFNEVYGQAPLVFNELINRRAPSSTASAARLRLIDLLFRNPTLPYLGLDPDKTPPEMSMYLSVIQETGLHMCVDDKWVIKLPEPDNDPGRLLPTFHEIKRYLSEKADERVKIDQLNIALRKPPFGVRDGLFYLLLAVYTAVYENEVAFYEDGTFIPRVTGNVFQRIIKAPETFDIQYFPITHVRSGLFSEIVRKLDLGKTGINRVELLDVVRPLVSFVVALPGYTKQTKRMSPQSVAVRDAIKVARDPASLLFNDLPKACNLRKIDKRETKSEVSVTPFVEALQKSVDEIKGAYPGLLKHITDSLFNEFKLEGTFISNREHLSNRAGSLAKLVTETRLKSFCLRLADKKLPDSKWAESLGSLVCASTPASWRDLDVVRYEQELHSLCAQFLRVEPIVFKSTEETDRGDAFRVSLTKESGEECDRIIHLTKSEKIQVDELKDKVLQLMHARHQVGLVAVTQALWDMLNESK